MKKCPFCAEEIQDAAIKCRYCGSDLIAQLPTQSSTPAPAAPSSEKTYFSEGAITVTSTRAVIGQRTYAMANITSVSKGKVPPNFGGPAALILLGLMMFFCVMGGSSAGAMIGAPGVVLMIIGVVLMVTAKPQFVVRLGSASGEKKALVSKDEAYIQKIVDAVNAAIVERG